MADTEQQTIADHIPENAVLANLPGLIIAGIVAAKVLGSRSRRNAVLALAGGAALARYGVRRLATHTDHTEPGALSTAEHIKRTITIRARPAAVAQVWLDPQKLARIVSHMAEVTPLDRARSRWVLKTPPGIMLAWEAEVRVERPGELLRIESLPGASLPNTALLILRQPRDPEETELTMQWRFEPPAGVVGAAAVRLLRTVPSTAMLVALQRARSLIETGEIPTNTTRRSGDD